jgi:hypothetical protein
MRLSASTISGRKSPCSSEQLVEAVNIDLGALEFRPGVFEVIGGVGAADDVDGNAALALKPCKGLERG